MKLAEKQNEVAGRKSDIKRAALEAQKDDEKKEEDAARLTEDAPGKNPAKYTKKQEECGE